MHRDIGLYACLGRSAEDDELSRVRQCTRRERCAKVDHEAVSELQRQRPSAFTAGDRAPGHRIRALRKVMGYRHLRVLLRAAFEARTDQIDTTDRRRTKAASSIRSRRECQLRMRLTRMGRAIQRGRFSLRGRLSRGNRDPSAASNRHSDGLLRVMTIRRVAPSNQLKDRSFGPPVQFQRFDSTRWSSSEGTTIKKCRVYLAGRTLTNYDLFIMRVAYRSKITMAVKRPVQ